MPLPPSDSLAKQLRRLAWIIEQGHVPDRIADRLDQAVDEVLKDLEHIEALQALADLLPHSSRWELASNLSVALKMFGDVPWRRIKAGGREARPGLETLYRRVLERDEAIGQRHLWERLKEAEHLNGRVQKIADTLPAIQDFA